MNWWLARADRTVSAQIPGVPDDVRAFYVNLDNIRAVHPLVVSVQSTDRSDTADGYVQTYAIHDRIPLGPARLPIRYVARLKVPRVGDVIADSYQFPQVHLHTVVSFQSADGGTLLTERMRIEAPRPLAAVTVGQAVDAHREMLSGIAARFA